MGIVGVVCDGRRSACAGARAHMDQSRFLVISRLLAALLIALLFALLPTSFFAADVATDSLMVQLHDGAHSLTTPPVTTGAVAAAASTRESLQRMYHREISALLLVLQTIAFRHIRHTHAIREVIECVSPCNVDTAPESSLSHRSAISSGSPAWRDLIGEKQISRLRQTWHQYRTARFPSLLYEEDTNVCMFVHERKSRKEGTQLV